MNTKKPVQCLTQSQQPTDNLYLQMSDGMNIRFEAGSASNSKSYGKVSSLRLCHQLLLYPLPLSMQSFPSCHCFCLARYNITLLWQNKHSAFLGFLAEYSKHNFPFADAVNCTNAHVILFRLWFHPVLTIMLPFCWSPCRQTSAGTHCASESDWHQLQQIDNFQLAARHKFVLNCTFNSPSENIFRFMYERCPFILNIQKCLILLFLIHAELSGMKKNHQWSFL